MKTFWIISAYFLLGIIGAIILDKIGYNPSQRMVMISFVSLSVFNFFIFMRRKRPAN